MKSDTRPLQIAIDGPVAAGKGDIASRLGRELQLVYIYTGAMYRMLALSCLKKGKSTHEEADVLAILDEIHMELVPPTRIQTDRVTTAMLDGVDVTDDIMRSEVAQGASDVATIPAVRRRMVELQQTLSFGKSVVMEGRDIGLRVLPDAQLKIFLTASVEERATRRLEQFETKGIHKTFEEVLEETKVRDAQDSSRATDPLKKLPDSWELDTTSMTQDQVVNAITGELRRRGLL